MGLIHGGGPQFAHFSLSETVPVAPNNFGESFTAGANNADGTAVSVMSALGHDAHLLTVDFQFCYVSTVTDGSIGDVLIDTAGGTSWSVLIPTLAMGQCAETTGAAFARFMFPIWIPAGSTLGFQARTSRTSDITTGRAVFRAWGNPKRPDLWWCGSKVEALGVTAASSTGTAVTFGNATWGSWTTIGTNTYRYGAIQLGIVRASGAQATRSFFTQLGVGSQPLDGVETHCFFSTTGENNSRHGVNITPGWCDIAPSSTIQARGMDQGGTEQWQLAAYGVY